MKKKWTVLCPVNNNKGDFTLLERNAHKYVAKLKESGNKIF